jgi:hypothetical protein
MIFYSKDLDALGKPDFDMNNCNPERITKRLYETIEAAKIIHSGWSEEQSAERIETCLVRLKRFEKPKT